MDPPVTRSSFSPAYRRLLAALAFARTSRGLTQVEVAQAMDRPQSYVSKVERGERRLDLVELVELARALDVDAHVLLDEVLAAIGPAE